MTPSPTAEVCFLAAAAVRVRRTTKPGRAGRTCVRVAEPTSRTWDLQRPEATEGSRAPAREPLLPSSRVLPRPGAAERCLLTVVAALPPGASEVYRHPAKGVRARDGAVPSKGYSARVLSASRRMQRLRLLRRQLADDHRGRRRSGGRYRPHRHHPPVAMDAQRLPAPAHLIAEEGGGPHERVEEVLRGDQPEPAERVVLAEEPEHAHQPHQAAAERPGEGGPAERAAAGHEERQAAPEHRGGDHGAEPAHRPAHAVGAPPAEQVPPHVAEGDRV